MIYRFDNFIFDGYNLTRDGENIPLADKWREILSILLEKAVGKSDRVVRLEDLKNELYKEGISVEDATVREHVSKLRLALGDRTDGLPYITSKKYQINPSVKVERLELEIFSLFADTDKSENSLIDSHLLEGANPNNSPYPGPQPFPVSYSEYFFGRKSDVANICQLLTNKKHRVILLYSPSGAGKTSLLNTALRKALEDKFNVLPTARLGVPTEKRTPGQNPYTLAAIASMEDDDISNEREYTTWTEYLLNVKKTAKKDTIVFIDQAEEILTVNFGEYQNKRDFFIEIRKALEKDQHLRFIISFREEFLAELQRVSQEISGFWTLYPLALLNLQNAEKAICNPAKLYGVNYAPDVLSRLLTKLATIRYLDYVGNPREESTEFVAPLQLQLTCDKLWKNLKAGQKIINIDDLIQANSVSKNEEHTLTHEEIVNRFVDSAIYDFCEKAVSIAASAHKSVKYYEFPGDLIYLGCRQFVSNQGIRIPVRKDEIGSGGLTKEIVEELVRQQFLRVEYRHGEPWYELAHDSLIDPLLQQIEKIDDDSLRAIFARAVQNAIEEGEWNEEKPEADAIIQECCLVFIGKDGSRLQISQEFLEKDSNRLPQYFVEAFLQRGILRKSILNSQQIYELTHQRLATAIHREKFLALNRLYKTRKLLDTYLDQLNVAEVSSDIWDDKSDKLLDDIKEILGIENLSEREAERVLRFSITTGRHLDYFVTQINKFYPELIQSILLEATKNLENSTVRRNGAYSFGLLDIKNSEEILFALALADKDTTVRKTAAYSLAKIDKVNLWSPIFSQLNEAEMRLKALKTLAWIHDTIAETKLNNFQNESKKLPFLLRMRLRTSIFGTRFHSARIKIHLILIVLLITTIITTAPPRAALATLNSTTTQVTNFGFVEGAFHGVAGAVLWSLFIGVPILFWWFVGERKRPWKGTYSLLVGGLGGLVGGIVNTFVLLEVFGKDSLSKIQWISSPQSDSIEVLTVTGMAFAMPIYGACVGLGTGEAARRMLLWWSEEEKSADNKELREITINICRNVTYYSLRILAPIMIAAPLILYFILINMPQQSVSFHHLIGESLSIFFGGVGLLIGLFLGLHIIKRGLPSLEN